VADSYARIFYRNSINAGLPIIICPGAVEAIASGETISIDFSNGVIICKSGELSFPPYPKYVQGIVDAGGLVAYTKQLLAGDSEKL